MSASVLVVEHEARCSADRLGRWLADESVELVVCRPYLGDAVPAGLAQDGLVVLGGHMGAHDDVEAPWLPATRALLAATAAAGAPVLGICLGAQLLAVACGGRVEVGAQGIEAGVVDVRWRAEAAEDPLFAGLEPSAPGPSMHLDAVVELPPGAVWLGATDTYPHQAFRLGAAVWGVQFHPEVSPEAYRSWVAGHADDWPRWGMDGDEVMASFERRDAELVVAGQRLARRFADVLSAGVPVGAPAPDGAGRYRR